MTPTLTLSLAALLSAEPAPALREVDRVRIAEAFRLADALGNRVWPGWDQAPFAVLLVSSGHEFLIRHPNPSSDFTPLGEDGVLKQKVWVRKRQFSPTFLATFPAVGGVPTVVIGRAEDTASKTSTRWVITLLHEHFHQLQYSRPGYYARVDALGLARGDQSGMWMLNYPFPYAAPAVRDQFAALGTALAMALSAEREADFAAKLEAYLAAKQKFRSSLKGDDYKYLAFQLWQEGTARYTELKLAELAAAGYEPTDAFKALKDYKPFGGVARALRADIDKEIASERLDRDRRTVVYNFGAAECLALDRANPAWRRRYFEEMFSLDGLFRPAK
jgi:hypothetical protein